MSNNRSPFGVMCDMWGWRTALKKAKEFEIPVSQEEIDAKKNEEEAVYKELSNFVKSVKAGKAGEERKDNSNGNC